MQTVSKYMSQHHAELDLLFEEFVGQQADKPAQAIPVADKFRLGLLNHIVWEEEILFPVFDERSGMQGCGPTAVMRSEHGRIKELLEEISAKLSRNELAGLAEPENELAEILRSHNRKEENILYPSIDALLTDEERENAFARMAAIVAPQTSLVARSA